MFREHELRKPRIDGVRPFNQALSDNGGQPIRVVVGPGGEKYIMQGNHRVYGALLDGLESVEGLLYTPDQWEALVGMPFQPGGTPHPTILP